ncbi:MAG: hypothetical protein HY456_01180 [Parcubacteria group bacterium]|nr:hypothetical protein [Parcubacteria group bacterium]
MHNKVKWIIAAGIILFMGVAVFFWLYFGNGETVQPGSTSAPKFVERSPVAPSLIKWPDEVYSAPPLPIGDISQPFNNFFDSLSNLPVVIPTGTQSISPSPAASSAVVVTEQELFAYAYPPDYRQLLGEFNEEMIADGFLKSGEIYPMDSMQDMVAFQDKFADYLAANSDLSSQEIEAYRKAYREVLPKMWADELRAKKAAQQTSFLPLKLWFHYREAVVKYKINSVFAYMKENFLVNAAYAQSECYREGAPNGVVGSQRSAPCCDCVVGKKHIPVGCLNKVCAGQPAIWDPDTKICGCNI